MQYKVFRYKDTHGRKESKRTCTPTLHSLLTFLSAPCSWQQISCEVVIWGLFLCVSLCGASQAWHITCQEEEGPQLCLVPAVCALLSCAGRLDHAGCCARGLQSFFSCRSCPTACPGLPGPQSAPQAAALDAIYWSCEVLRKKLLKVSDLIL